MKRPVKKDYKVEHTIEQCIESADSLSALNSKFKQFIEQNGIEEVVDFAALSDSLFMKRFQFGINSWPIFVSPQTNNEFATN